jgi:hypothetical protein
MICMFINTTVKYVINCLNVILVFDCSNGRAHIALQIGKKMKLALFPVHST